LSTRRHELKSNAAVIILSNWEENDFKGMDLVKNAIVWHDDTQERLLML
jgi:hypothetical protein